MSQSATELFRTSCGATIPLELKVSGPGWAGGERGVFDQPFVLVGRHECATLRLEDAAVSRRHVYLQQFGQRVFCVDLGSRTGTRWAGKARPAGWLRPDHGIQVGPFTLELPADDSGAGSLSDEVAEESDPLQDRVDEFAFLPRITVESENKVLAHMRMNRTLVLIGSAPACRIRLREHGIALYHCSLVRTPEGVWMIDLLNETGTCLDGKPVRWALVKEGSQLQVGPYLLRFSYPVGPIAAPLCKVLEIRAEAGVQSAEDASDSRRRLFQDKGVLAPDVAVPRAEPFADEASRLVPTLQAELDQARERLRDAEAVKQQLADSQTECGRLRDQVRTFEIQLADVAGLQARLEAAEASTRRLKMICAEGDQWQERLEAAQQQLVKEREAVCTARLRLDQESTALQGIRTDLAVRNAEHRAALQRLQVAQDELARSQDEICGLQAELNQTHEGRGDAEALKQQLADSQAECVRLRDQAGTLENRLAEMAGLQARLEAAEAGAGQLGSVCAERDQWRQQHEAAQQELVEEREAVCALELRLDQEIAVLHGVRAESTTQNAEHNAALQRLQETQDELGRSRDELRGLQAELDQVREQLRDTETLREQLADRQAECIRLRDQAGTHDDQVAEIAELQACLQTFEAGARQLEAVCAERDQWQQRFVDVQQQFVAEREAVGAARLRSDQESAALRTTRADLAVRDAEHNAALQRLQEAQDELGRSQDEIRGLQAELNQASEQLRDTEAAGQLADSQAECVQLRDQIRTLGRQLAEMAELQARLQTLEGGARQLEIACAERDQWQAEAQSLQTRLASDPVQQERLDSLAADLNAAREERDRLLAEQQTSLHAAEQARARVSELEQALAEAAAARERIVAETSAGWESERQALQASLQQVRLAQNGAAQTAVRDFQVRAEAAIREVQARAAADRDTWQKRLDGAEAQIVWERGLFQEQGEKLRQQLASLQTERDRLAARLAEAESSLRTGQPRPPNEPGRVPEPETQQQVAVLDQIFVEFGMMRMPHMLGQAGARPDKDKKDF